MRPRRQYLLFFYLETTRFWWLTLQICPKFNRAKPFLLSYCKKKLHTTPSLWPETQLFHQAIKETFFKSEFKTFGCYIWLLFFLAFHTWHVTSNWLVFIIIFITFDFRGNIANMFTDLFLSAPTKYYLAHYNQAQSVYSIMDWVSVSTIIPIVPDIKTTTVSGIYDETGFMKNIIDKQKTWDQSHYIYVARWGMYL